MSEKNKEIPKICTLRGLKPEVFRRAHKKAQELELSGKVLLSDDWKQIMHQSWDEVKEEVKKVCPCNQPGDEKLEEESILEEIQEDIQDGQHHPEEDPMQEEQPVQQVEQDDVDAAFKEPPEALPSEQTVVKESSEEKPPNADNDQPKPVEKSEHSTLKAEKIAKSGGN